MKVIQFRNDMKMNENDKWYLFVDLFFFKQLILYKAVNEHQTVLKVFKVLLYVACASECPSGTHKYVLICKTNTSFCNITLNIIWCLCTFLSRFFLSRFKHLQTVYHFFIYSRVSHAFQYDAQCHSGNCVHMLHYNGGWMALRVLTVGRVPFYNSQLCDVVLKGFFASDLSLSIYHMPGIGGRFHLHSEYTWEVYLSLMYKPQLYSKDDAVNVFRENVSLTFNQMNWKITWTRVSYIQNKPVLYEIQISFILEDHLYAVHKIGACTPECLRSFVCEDFH